MATLTLRFAERAERQLDDILAYIAINNPDAADSIATHVEQILNHALNFPDMGRQVFSELPFREVKAYPCRIIYRRTNNILWVVAVLRVEQLLRLELLTGQ